VIVRLREAIVGELVPAAQQAIGAEMQRLLGSGKVADSGVFTDDRAGFLILNADSADELFDLVGGLLDLARLEVHPLTTYERLGAFFEQQAARRTSGAGHP
jgi:hypothetical protein